MGSTILCSRVSKNRSPPYYTTLTMGAPTYKTTTLDSKKLECGYGMVCDGCSAFRGFGIPGRSYSNLLAKPLIFGTPQNILYNLCYSSPKLGPLNIWFRSSALRMTELRHGRAARPRTTSRCREPERRRRRRRG